MSVLILLVAAIAAWVGFTRWSRGRRRRMAGERPFPPEWRDILIRNVALYERMPDDLRPRLERDIHVFLEEKTFFGCGGLEITDEIRVTIAAQACVLLLNRDDRYYPRHDSIFVYPSAYVANAEFSDGGIVAHGKSVRLGEAWDRGPVVLAWDSVLTGGDDGRDGSNVTLHEFAHQLDFEDNIADGTPALTSWTAYGRWGRTMSAEYLKLRENAENGRISILDRYGATNPAEFFAVATEAFFERSTKLQDEHPELYGELRSFYGVDPAAWASPSHATPADRSTD